LSCEKENKDNKRVISKVVILIFIIVVFV